MRRAAIILCSLFFLSGCSPCENEIYKIVSSPNEKYSALIFNRTCGATVEYNTQVSIVEFGTKDNNSGNILVIDNHPKNTNLFIKWLSDDEISIKGLEKNKVYKKEFTVKKIKINYE